MNLTINNTTISMDSEGRYSINDLHKSSGGKIKDLPNKFMASKSFKEMSDLLLLQNHKLKPVSKKSGRYGGGTWLCKELVIKYAMWINVEFELKVIETFDEITSNIKTCSTMKELNELSKKIMSDKNIASQCGRELEKYKRVKNENERKWIESIELAQLSFGFN